MINAILYTGKNIMIQFLKIKIKEGKHFKDEFITYEEAREKLAEQLIKVYKNENSV